MLWRYRHELAPLYASGALWVTSSAAHESQVHPLLPLASGAAVTAATLTADRWAGRVKLRKLGPLARTEERRYAATCAAVGGSWLTLATAAGPTAPGMTWPMLVLLTAACGTPWWKHHRIRRRVTVDRTVAAWPQLTDTAGVPGKVTLGHVVASGFGWSANFKVTPPLTARELKNYEHSLAAAIARIVRKNLPEDAVTIEPKGIIHGTIHVLEKDPHAETQVWSPENVIRSVTQPMRIGPYADGMPCMLPIWVPGSGMQMIGVSGVKGSGKSSLLDLIIANLAHCADVHLLGIDRKGGQAFRPWRGVFSKMETTPEGSLNLIRWLNAEIDRRGATVTGRVWRPTPDDPGLVLMIDEAAELSDEEFEQLRSVVRRGRSVGIAVVLATQYPTTDVIDAQVLAQLDTRFTFRLARTYQRRVAMLNHDGRDPALFPKERAGTSYYEDAGASDLPLRVEFVTDQQIADIAERQANGTLHLLGVEEVERELVRRTGDADDAAELVAEYREVGDSSDEEDVPLTPEEEVEALHDPDQLPPVNDLPADQLRVQRPDLAVREEEIVDDVAVALLNRALRTAPPEGIRPRELKKLTRRGNTWVHEQLDHGISMNTVVRLRRGRYRAREEMTTPI